MSTLLFIWFFVCVLSILLIVLMLLPGDTWQTLCHCQLDLTLRTMQHRIVPRTTHTTCPWPGTKSRYVVPSEAVLAVSAGQYHILSLLHRHHLKSGTVPQVMNTVANLTDFTLAHIHYYVTARNILKEKISKRKKGAIKPLSV